ncbi:AraC family transcriptional regulator [Paenibacillus sp. GYB003]|uniref:AraC family transcriptional regulator n=1 Tax=Paenibacillus sp. GYB003 TaxID=2994392 RepID=UPI002F966A1C
MQIRVGLPDMTSTFITHNVHVRVAEPGYSFRMEFHPTFELLHCWEGDAVEYVRERPVPFQTGDWVLIRPGTKHRLQNNSERPVTLLSIHFDIDDPMLRKQLNVPGMERIPRKAAERTMIPRYMRDFETVILNGLLRTESRSTYDAINISSGDKLAVQACMLLIVGEITKIAGEMAAGTRDPEPDEPTRHETEIAHRIEDFLRLHGQRSVTIQDIARHIGLSRGRCTAIFTKVYGMPPRQYVTMLKLNKAKELLVRTSLTVEAIADELGFYSVSHFSRQFKRWTGQPPLSFRPKTMQAPGRPDG